MQYNTRPNSFNVSCVKNSFQLLGSNQEIVSHFVSITRIKNRDNAEWVLEEQGWDLDKALAWFYEHKDDEEEREYFETEMEEDEERQGKYIVFILTLSRTMINFIVK